MLGCHGFFKRRASRADERGSIGAKVPAAAALPIDGSPAGFIILDWVEVWMTLTSTKEWNKPGQLI